MNKHSLCFFPPRLLDIFQTNFKLLRSRKCIPDPIFFEMFLKCRVLDITAPDLALHNNFLCGLMQM